MVFHADNYGIQKQKKKTKNETIISNAESFDVLSGETLTELYIDTVNFFFIAIVNYTSRSSLRCQEKGNTQIIFYLLVCN